MANLKHNSGFGKDKVCFYIKQFLGLCLVFCSLQFWILKRNIFFTNFVSGGDVDVHLGELLDDGGVEHEGVAVLRPVRRNPVGHDGRFVLVSPVSLRTANSKFKLKFKGKCEIFKLKLQPQLFSQLWRRGLKQGTQLKSHGGLKKNYTKGPAEMTYFYSFRVGFYQTNKERAK